MAFDVLKTETSTDSPTFDKTVVTSALVAGIKDGTVYSCHTAVHSANLATGKKLSGNEICGIYDKLVNDLKKMSSTADSLAMAGTPEAEIKTQVNEMSENFTGDNVFDLKIELYGSISNWLNAMTKNEV